ncbi:hypothetical protein L1987_43891 [Smallanthus sonchifolius]|uniref:Uncharacterized protein n=1 Tax=Smallanthus sonchifolius TaxID=185202 RepID=A0ACB9GNX1_9ASTR|nr:hypothetical protein L1987_43891 [Smallanthus sonchifolius]
MIRCWSNFKLFVRGGGRETDDSLREAFSAHGEVTEAKVIMDQKTGRSRGFGFVTFADYESARNAIDTRDQWLLHGRTVTVRWANDAGGDFPSVTYRRPLGPSDEAGPDDFVLQNVRWTYKAGNNGPVDRDNNDQPVKGT